jgi:hypothetical protein
MSLRFRWATLLTAVALTFGGAQAASATTGTATQLAPLTGLSPAPSHCLYDDPSSCGLQLPDGGVDHPPHGGGHTPGGTPGDGISGGNHDTYCAELRAAMGDSANTPFGMQLLASAGC